MLKACAAAALATDADTVGETEVAPGLQLPVPRFSPLPPGRSTTGRVEAMAHYAGQSVDQVTGRKAAAEIVHELTADL